MLLETGIIATAASQSKGKPNIACIKDADDGYLVRQVEKKYRFFQNKAKDVKTNATTMSTTYFCW